MIYGPYYPGADKLGKGNRGSLWEQLRGKAGLGKLVSKADLREKLAPGGRQEQLAECKAAVFPVCTARSGALSGRGGARWEGGVEAGTLHTRDPREESEILFGLQLEATQGLIRGRLSDQSFKKDLELLAVIRGERRTFSYSNYRPLTPLSSLPPF